MVTVKSMIEHCEQLCDDYQINWYRAAGVTKAISIAESYTIETPLIRGPISYSLVMHEIGHCLGRYQHGHYRTWTRQFWAWDWARRHALLWTPQMERKSQACLSWYSTVVQGETRATRIDRKLASWGL